MDGDERERQLRYIARTPIVGKITLVAILKTKRSEELPMPTDEDEIIHQILQAEFPAS